MTCKNCKKERHTKECDSFCHCTVFFGNGNCSKEHKCDCNGLEVEMVEVGKIKDVEEWAGFQLIPKYKTLYQCPNCRAVVLS